MDIPAIVTVPLKALAVRPPGEGGEEAGEPISPQIGDPVDFAITGAVDSIDGENASIKVLSVNGQPVAAAAQPQPEGELPPDDSVPPPPGGEMTEEDVRGLAEEADKQATGEDYI